ncbi:MAG: Lrp/AsnC family leucine-responsive transcriptional regulator [Arenicella sp.]|jgi:Lrp/AsnC family leucine-responsive transcriptional regulator
MTLEKNYSLDGVDVRMLTILQTDGRISIRELAQTINMSAPSITERLRRLQSRGIIRNFSVDLDLSILGYPLQAIVRIKPRPGKLKEVETMIENQLRFVSCDRVTGDDCYIAKLMLRSIDELDDLLEPFHDCAETNTSIVKSSLIKKRQPLSK